MNLGMAAAVISFLSITPNLYNKGNENPGLIGLEANASSDKTANAKGDVKNENK